MKNLIILTMVTLFTTGCDWRVFDDLEKSATVQIIESPDSFSGSNFGQVTSYLKDQNGKIIPELLIVGGAGQYPFVIIDFTDNVVTKYPVGLNDAVELEISNIVPLNSDSNGYNIAISSLNKIYILNISLTETEEYMATVTSSITDLEGVSEFGRSFDVFDSDSGDRYIAIASSTNIYVYPSFDSTSVRTIVTFENFELPSNTDSYTYDFVKFFTYNNTDYVAVGGTETSSGQWEIQLIPMDSDFSISDERTILKSNSAYQCTGVYSIKINDIDQDQKPDILAGCGGEIFLFESSNSAGNNFVDHPTGRLYSPDRYIGELIEVTDITGDGIPEIISTDPDTSENNSGELYIFSTPVLTSPLSPAVIIKTPENEKLFGSSICAVPTKAAPNRYEIVAGGKNTLYLYYITGFTGDALPADDPRNIN